MKLNNLLFPIALVVVACAAFAVYNANSAPLPEGFPEPTPPNQIEVKQYPAYRAATYQTDGKLVNAANNAFYPLYQHISSNKISMTAPVETRYPLETINGESEGEAEVSFLYSSPRIVPKEISGNIEVKDMKPMMAVSLGLQGAYSYESYQSGLQRLSDWLKEHKEYRISGNPRRFFYDGPYIPDALKRSEILIPIEVVHSGKIP
jgi:hypothetical protein